MRALWYEVVLGSAVCEICIRSRTGKSFVEALSYEVVLGSTLCELCSTM